MLNLRSFSPSKFERCVSEAESNPEELISIMDWAEGSPTTTNELPMLFEFSAMPVGDVPTNDMPKLTTVTSSLMPDDVESLPYLRHAPGPIQRPNKLNHSLTTAATPGVHPKTSFQSPTTPDCLYQINHLLSENTGYATKAAQKSPCSSSMMSPLINDWTTANIPWTFSSNEWSPKLESTWSMPVLQNSNNPLSTAFHNPFNVISPTPNTREASLWSSSIAHNVPSSFASSTVQTQDTSAWNDLLSSTGPEEVMANLSEVNGNLWEKFIPQPDPSITDAISSLDGPEMPGNNSIWGLTSLSDDSIVPTSSNVSSEATSRLWWTSMAFDENNNTNRANHNNSTACDRSRWDLAR